MVLARELRWIGAACLLGCSPGAHIIPDGGPPLELVVATPPGAQLGLRYGKTIELRVLYRTSDAHHDPIAGDVRFGIFGDPAGSTLSRDLVTTDSDGAAAVNLTAGAAEASFRVAASAANAPDAVFEISVSKLDFVTLSVQLSYPTAPTLDALLFEDTSCAAIGAPQPTPPSGGRSLTGAGPQVTLSFVNLLSKAYTVLGRAEDAMGRLVAAGCADLPASLLPSGAIQTLALPLAPVTPSLVGSYDLTSSFTVREAATIAPWHTLADCSNGGAQLLLDATEAGLASPLKAQIDAQRQAADAKGCRGGTTTIDPLLEAALSGAGAPGLQLMPLGRDVIAIVDGATLLSQLTVASAGAAGLVGDHALTTLKLASANATTVSYDLPSAALPIVEARDVPVGYDGATATLGAHAFTLNLPGLQRRAVADLALKPRFPTLMPPSARAVVGAVVAAAASHGKTGCAAVEDVVCGAVGAGCSGVAAACTAALDPLAATLDAPLADSHGLDFTLHGSAATADSDGDLAVDHLTGSWTSPQVSLGPFTGVRHQP